MGWQTIIQENYRASLVILSAQKSQVSQILPPGSVLRAILEILMQTGWLIVGQDGAANRLGLP